MTNKDYVTVKGISARKLLERVYDNLFWSESPRGVRLDEPAYVHVSTDQRSGGDRWGYMVYKAGKVVSLNGTDWFIAKGRSQGSYTIDWVSRDIRVWAGNEPSENRNPFMEFSPFSNPPIIATSQGNICTPKHGTFGGLLGSELEEIEPYDLTPNKRYTMFNPEFVDVVVGKIEEAIRKVS